MADISASLVKALRDKTNAGMMDCKRALLETNGDLEAAADWLRKKGLSTASNRSGRVASEGLVGVSVSGARAAIVEVNSETDFVARNAIFQEFVASVARVAVDVEGDLAAIKQSALPSGRTVADEITHLAATVGENIMLRRAAGLSAEQGIIASYVHGAHGPGVGRIGVLIALGADTTDQAVADVGKKLAMHVAAANPLFVSRADVTPAALDRERAILVEQARASGKPEAVVQKMVEGRLAKFYEEVCLLEQAFVMQLDTKVGAILEAAGRTLGCPLHVRGFIRYAVGEGAAKPQDDVTAA